MPVYPAGVLPSRPVIKRVSLLVLEYSQGKIRPAAIEEMGQK